jgi:hypothetical protein
MRFYEKDGKIVLEFDAKEACGLLEDMNEVAYCQLYGGKPWIEREFEGIRKELMKLLDEVGIE